MSTKKKTKPAKVGRPPLPARMQRTEQLNVRATKAERTMLEAKAKKLGVSLSYVLMAPWRECQKGR